MSRAETFNWETNPRNTSILNREELIEIIRDPEEVQKRAVARGKELWIKIQEGRPPGDTSD